MTAFVRAKKIINPVQYALVMAQVFGGRVQDGLFLELRKRLRISFSQDNAHRRLKMFMNAMTGLGCQVATAFESKSSSTTRVCIAIVEIEGDGVVERME